MVTPGTINEKSDLLATAQGIRLLRQGQVVLDAVDIQIRAGEILALIGPNGAGKTSLVRVLLGLVKPERGEVRLQPGLRVGYMPQRMALDSVLPLTVRRFLTLGQRCGDPELRRVLREVGGESLLERPIQAISGGELQRVLLARALLREPRLLILDEPVQGVDITGQAELFDLIGRIRERHGCGILMVSHDLHLVMAKTDRVLCLNHHVCCSGHPESVSADPAYLALFGDHSAVALYTHNHDHRHDLGGRVVEEEPHRHG